MTPRVLFTQPNLVRDERTGAQRPKINPAHVRDYGEATYLLEDSQIATAPALAVTLITERLQELNYDPERDYLCVTGDLTLAMLMFHEMMRLRHAVRVLRWDNHRRKYDILVFTEDAEELTQ